MNEEDRIKASLKYLGMPEGKLELAADKAHKFMVKYCQETGDLAPPGVIARGCGISGGTISRTLADLVKQGRVAKVGPAKYLPLIPED